MKNMSNISRGSIGIEPFDYKSHREKAMENMPPTSKFGGSTTGKEIFQFEDDSFKEKPNDVS